MSFWKPWEEIDLKLIVAYCCLGISVLSLAIILAVVITEAIK